MTSLVNTDLRARDIFKIAVSISKSLTWDEGIEPKNEWVFVSVSDEPHLEKTRAWLVSKCVPLNTQIVVVRSVSEDVERLQWSAVLHELENIFVEGAGFSMFDVELSWHLEFMSHEVARFGRYNRA